MGRSNQEISLYLFLKTFYFVGYLIRINDRNTIQYRMNIANKANKGYPLFNVMAKYGYQSNG